MENFLQKGHSITWTNGTGSAVVAGQAVVVGTMIGVAAVDIANGATGAVHLAGVFELIKTTHAADQAIAAGDAVIFDVSTGKFSKPGTAQAAGDITGNVVAFAAAATTSAVVQVKLCGNPGTVSAG